MNCTLSDVLIFVVGGAVGSLATWQILKKHYEKNALEEVQQIRDFYYNLYQEKSEESDEIKDNAEVTDERESDYAELIQANGYIENITKEDEKVTTKEPYVISPDEYGENEEYETLSFTYYADGVLTDDMDDPIDDVDDIVGEDSLNHFGEYEDDTVFVRNERLKCDYEICRDTAVYYGENDKDHGYGYQE